MDAGISTRGGNTRTAPFSDSATATKLGLGKLYVSAEEFAGRKVTYMIYRSLDALAARGLYQLSSGDTVGDPLYGPPNIDQ